jgi:hypothetical protein
MKYWFRDSQKKFFYWFSGRKTGFYEKKSPSLCRLPWFHGCPYENFVRPIFERCFHVRDFSFRITEGIGLTGVSFHFWPQKKFRRVAAIGFFGSFFTSMVKNLPILMFLGLIWCKILCWAQKSILFWNATESHESPKTEFVSHEIFISRVTYPSIINFMLSSKKYTL